MRSKLTLAFACACALGVALAGAATLQAETTPEPPAETQTETAQPEIDQWQIQRKIDRYRHETWRWQRTDGPQAHSQPREPARGRRREDRALEAGRIEDARERPESALTSVSGSASTATKVRGPTRIRRITAACRWISGSSARMRRGCSHTKGRRTTGRRSSRCGLLSERTVPAAGSTPGRTRRATAV